MADFVIIGAGQCGARAAMALREQGFDGGITLVGESLNDLADPRLRGRRRAAIASGEVAETSVVPGGPLEAGPGGVDGLEGGESFDEHGIEVRP